ncbi:MAG: carbon monoxide dehydrogenase subunit G [Pyrinomonadaceae bacterium]
MKIQGSYQLNAKRERVYQLLVDKDVLQRCIPGCEQLEQTGPDTFAATIKAGVGSIKGVFKGSVRLEERRPPEHLRLVIDGKGNPGFMKGSGDLNLEQQGNNTSISYSGDVQVGGTIAGVGQRMIESTAKMMATQFFVAMGAEAAASPGDSPPRHGFFRTTLRWFSGWLRRMLER